MSAEKTQNVQDVFLNHIRKNKVPVTIFLINGVKLQGVVSSFDNFSLLLRRDGHVQPAGAGEVEVAKEAVGLVQAGFQPRQTLVDGRQKAVGPGQLGRQFRQVVGQCRLLPVLFDEAQLLVAQPLHDQLVEVILLLQEWAHVPFGGHTVPQVAEAGDERSDQRRLRMEGLFFDLGLILEPVFDFFCHVGLLLQLLATPCSCTRAQIY
jgi:RNA chaperone Hfq